MKSVLDTFDTGDGQGGKFNTTLVAVKIAARLASAQLKVMATNVRILAGAFKILTFIPRTLGTVAGKIVGVFVRPIINAFGFIVNAAAKAFGWVPGLGGKLKNAAASFAVFKARALAALDGFDKVGFQVGTAFATNLAAAIAGNGKVTTAVAQGTANKVRANASSLLGVDRRKAGGAGTVNVTVNNPKPERASESTTTAIARATSAAGWAAA